MFKLFICSVFFVALVCADHIDKNAEILSLQSVPPNAEGYKYAYETSNGIKISEGSNSPDNVQGSLNYISPEGERIELTYTADENGFHPVGDHLPTPPPVPAYVLRALEYIRSHPPAQLKDQQ